MKERLLGYDFFLTHFQKGVFMNGINSFRRGYSFKMSKTNLGEKAVSRMVSKHESGSLPLPRCTPSLKNMNKYSLDWIDSELLNPLVNSHY